MDDAEHYSRIGASRAVPDFAVPGSDHMGLLQKEIGEHHWVQFLPNYYDAPNAAPRRIPPVFVALGKSEDGRLICTGLIIGEFGSVSYGTSEVTARALREIKIPELVQAAKDATAGSGIHAGLGDTVPTLKRQPRGGDDEYLQLVARLYKAALAEDPQRPMKWLAEKLGDKRGPKPMPTMRRHVKKARERGYLGPARPGKAGEWPQT